MVKVQIELSEEENKKVNVYMAENNISDKRKAIKHIIKEDVKLEINRLDPNLDEKDNTFKCALILIMGLRLGTNMKEICKFLNFKYTDKIKEYEKNLIENKIWFEGKLNVDWFSKNGGISFWIDVLTMQGLVGRCEQKNNTIKN